jgi:dipeptidyl aminopeptidase/acylaminoacyl peptidase
MTARGASIVFAAALALAAAPRARAQTASAEPALEPPEALALDGVPPIPRALADRVALYTESRAATFADWHPTRRAILITTRFSNVNELHAVAFPGGARKQLTFYPEPVSSGEWRPKTADGIVFAKDTGGNEFYQLYWRDAKTGAATMFTDGKSRNGGVVFSNGGKWLAYNSTRRNGKDDDIYVVDPADRATERRLLEVEGGGWGVEDWSPDDATLLVREFISSTKSRLWLVDAASGAKKPLSPERAEEVSYGHAAFAKDGRSVYVATDLDAEFMRLCALDLASGKIEPLTAEIPHDVSTFDLSPDGARLAFVVNEAGIDRLHLLDLATRKEAPLPALPAAGTIRGVKFHANSKDLAFTLNAARTPADVFSIDVAAGTLERWTESETGGLEAGDLAEPEPLAWKSFDGREITGFLYMPPGRWRSGPRPVVIMIHGGPESQFQPGFLGRQNYLLNELGVALIFPNVRGSSGFGKTFLKLDNAEKREDAVKDIGALLDWIAADPRLDKTRVMVRGGSYGGYMALASMVHYADRLRCGVDEVGIANFVSFLERTEAYRRDLRRVEYGDERDPAMRAFLTRISPVNNVERMTQPMLIVAGKNDPRVPYTEAEQIVAALKKREVPVWYVLGKDEGHGFAKKRNADFEFLVVLRFMEEYMIPRRAQ